MRACASLGVGAGGAGLPPAAQAHLARNRRTFVSQSDGSISPPSDLIHTIARASYSSANQSAALNARMRIRFRGAGQVMSKMEGLSEAEGRSILLEQRAAVLEDANTRMPLKPEMLRLSQPR